MKSQITGRVTTKTYKCNHCGHITKTSTNHYGDIYIRCTKCAWKRPMEISGHFTCMDPLPEGWGTPEPWRTVKLGDILKPGDSS